MNDRMNDVILPLGGALRRRTASAVCAAVIFSAATAVALAAVALASDESGGLTPAPTARGMDAAGFNDAPAVADGSASAAFVDSDGFTRSDDFARGLIRRLDGDARVFGYRALHAALNTLDGGDLDSELRSIRTSAGDALFAAVADGALERLRLGLDDSFIRSFSLSYQSPFASGGAKASASAVAALWGDSERLLFAQFGGRAAIDSTDSNYGSFGFGLRRRVGGAIFGGNVFADLTAGGNRRHSFGLEARHRGAALAANVYVGDGHLASGRTIEGSGRIPGLADWAEFGAKFSQWDGSAADGGDELAAEYRLSFYPLEGFRVNFKQSQEAGAAASRGVLAEFGWLLGAAGVAGAAIALGDSNGDDDINSPVVKDGGFNTVTPSGDPANPAVGFSATGQAGESDPLIMLDFGGDDPTARTEEGDAVLITLTADATPSATELNVTMSLIAGVSGSYRDEITKQVGDWALATPKLGAETAVYPRDYHLFYTNNTAPTNDDVELVCDVNRVCVIDWTDNDDETTNRVVLRLQTLDDSVFELSEVVLLAVLDGEEYEANFDSSRVGAFTGGSGSGTGTPTPPPTPSGPVDVVAPETVALTGTACDIYSTLSRIGSTRSFNAASCSLDSQHVAFDLIFNDVPENGRIFRVTNLPAGEWQVQVNFDLQGNPTTDGRVFNYNRNGSNTGLIAATSEFNQLPGADNIYRANILLPASESLNFFLARGADTIFRVRVRIVKVPPPPPPTFPVAFSVSWGGTANLNLELYDSGDVLVDRAETNSNPEELSANLAAGYYCVAVRLFTAAPSTTEQAYTLNIGSQASALTVTNLNGVKTSGFTVAADGSISAIGDCIL